MSDIPDERKRQIRAEEEARAKQRAEDKYREEVRRELEGAPPTTVKGHAPAPRPAPAEPPAEPARPAVGRRRGGRLMIAIGALLIVGGTVATVVGMTRRSGEPAERTAGGSEPLAASAPKWNPAELGYEELDVRDGKLVTVPDPGITTLAELRALEAAGPHASRESEEGPPPRAPARGMDALLGHVPADAFAVLALDLDRARSSRAVMDGLDTMLQQTGLASRINALGVMTRANAIVLAGVPAGPREDPWPVVVIRGSFDATKFPTGNGVGVDGDLVVITVPEVFDRAMSGSSVLSAGELADALTGVRGGPTGFGAIRMMDEMKTELAQVMPDLEKIRWLAGTIDTTTGIVLSGNAVFPDDMIAAKIAIAINLGRKLAASQLPSPAVAAAVDKLAFTAMGNAIRISAQWAEADVQALLSVAR